MAALSAAGARIVATDHKDTALARSLAALEAPDRHLGVPDIDLSDEQACGVLIARALEPVWADRWIGNDGRRVCDGASGGDQQ
jgi:hypothetical protein